MIKFLTIIYSLFFINTSIAATEYELQINSKEIIQIKKYILCPALIYTLALEGNAFKVDQKKIELENGCAIKIAGYKINSGMLNDRKIKYFVENKSINDKFFVEINTDNQNLIIKIDGSNEKFIQYLFSVIQNKIKKNPDYYAREINKIKISSDKIINIIKSDNIDKILGYSFRQIINNRNIYSNQTHTFWPTYLDVNKNIENLINYQISINGISLNLFDKFIEIFKFILLLLTIHLILKK